MYKTLIIERVILIFTSMAVCFLLAGCQTSAGPWGGRAYQRPSSETPVHEARITPGSPLPFEHRLPTGNLNAPTGAGVRN